MFHSIQTFPDVRAFKEVGFGEQRKCSLGEEIAKRGGEGGKSNRFAGVSVKQDKVTLVVFV